MIHNKRLLWGIGAALLLINAIAAFIIMQRRQEARKQTHLRSAASAVGDALHSATQSVEEVAEEVARTSLHNFNKLRDKMGGE